MLSEITHRQLLRWRAWYDLMHLGESPEDRADIRMAIGTSVLANHWREKKPLKPEQLLPFPPEREVDPQAQAAEFRAGFLAYIKRKQVRQRKREGATAGPSPRDSNRQQRARHANEQA